MITPDTFPQSKIADLAQRIAGLPKKPGRWLVAIAGAPAGGKSILAANVTAAVNEAGRSARAIPMDGFHLDNEILAARGLLPRKGAPETFDADGFIHLIRRLKDGGEVVYPLFDRSRDLAIAGAAVIEAECDVAIIEGAKHAPHLEKPEETLAAIVEFCEHLDTMEAAEPEGV